eukprot:Lithocolla_globosa_v1_NODE_265_length_4744_cov_7.305396.p9 type:complete len:125 gc:universal NODE_265_length_4744_cov_7.305396:4018-4392(+)
MLGGEVRVSIGSLYLGLNSCRDCRSVFSEDEEVGNPFGSSLTQGGEIFLDHILLHVGTDHLEALCQVAAELPSVLQFKELGCSAIGVQFLLLRARLKWCLGGPSKISEVVGGTEILTGRPGGLA